MIEILNLSKQYLDKHALNNLNLTIPSGQIFGLLGHNGAGKSTTIKSLVSIIEPTSGQIIIDGLDLATHREQIKRKIAYVPDSPDIFLQLTASEYWQVIMAAYELPNVTQTQQRLQELTTLFNMSDVQDNVLSSFSHGMRQKALLIGALLPDPDIWILDEPLHGLDPQAAYDLKELMIAHAKKGKTVIFSTHVLDSAEQLCDQLAILRQGELIYNGSVSDLLLQSTETSLEKTYLQMTGRCSEQKVAIEHA